MLLPSFLQPRCRACRRRAPLRRLGEVSPTHTGQFHTNRFRLVHCPRCDVVYLDPPPKPRDLHVLYEESAQFSDAHYTAPEQVTRMLEYYSHSMRVLGLLQEAGARVLEVGAGFAWVSRACKGIDPECETVAQDVTSECAELCPWVDRYFVGRLEDLPDAGSFDLASMTHVIEHLVDPQAMLAAIGARLSEGGKLFVTAPYRPNGWTVEQGLAPWLDYAYLHVPAHVTYLSRDWFEQVVPPLGMHLVHWDARHDDGQAFEAVLERR